jgi:hypothetical protein
MADQLAQASNAFQGRYTIERELGRGAVASAPRWTWLLT